MSEEPKRIELLVSVRSAMEAGIAHAGGADIIDVKEPARGPMGKADLRVIEEVLHSKEVPAEKPRTVALGELIDGQLQQNVRKLLAVGVPTTAKVGFSNTTSAAHLLRVFAQTALAARPLVELAPVFYADHREIGCPRFDLVLDAAASAGCKMIVVDTFVKDGRRLWNWLAPDILAWMVDAAAGKSIRLAAAGSLNAAAALRLQAPFPAIVGVRGAVCRNGRRDGQLDGALIQALRVQLDEIVRPKAAGQDDEPDA